RRRRWACPRARRQPRRAVAPAPRRPRMRTNRVKQRLAAGEVVVGTMVWELMTPAVFRIAEAAGAEFVLFDQEHPPWSLERIRDLIAAGRAGDVVPFVRVPDAAYHFVARTL